MAAIDKIYGTTAQWDEFYEWLSHSERPQYRRFFYDRDGYQNEIRPIANFPLYADYWLRLQCPIKWVLDALDEQHGVKYNIELYEKGRPAHSADGTQDRE